REGERRHVDRQEGCCRRSRRRGCSGSRRRCEEAPWERGRTAGGERPGRALPPGGTQVHELRPRPILAGDAPRQLVVEAVKREQQPQSEWFVQRDEPDTSDRELVERKVRQLEREQSDEGAALQPGQA